MAVRDLVLTEIRKNASRSSTRPVRKRENNRLTNIGRSLYETSASSDCEPGKKPARKNRERREPVEAFASGSAEIIPELHGAALLCARAISIVLRNGDLRELGLQSAGMQSNSSLAQDVQRARELFAASIRLLDSNPEDIRRLDARGWNPTLPFSLRHFRVLSGIGQAQRGRS